MATQFIIPNQLSLPLSLWPVSPETSQARKLAHFPRQQKMTKAVNQSRFQGANKYPAMAGLAG